MSKYPLCANSPSLFSHQFSWDPSWALLICWIQVTQVINIVLDVALQRGHLITADTYDTKPSAVPGSKMSYRDHVVRELVDTERKYVQDLENLHELKRTIEQRGVIPGDVVHDIFLNINAILDFQRRFLIRIETTNSQPDERQEWGLPFSNYEEAFGIYQPFIANQRKAAAIAMREFDKISQADHPVVVDFNTLDGFLLKPMQRLVKYPLLLKVQSQISRRSFVTNVSRTSEIKRTRTRKPKLIWMRESKLQTECSIKQTPLLIVSWEAKHSSTCVLAWTIGKITELTSLGNSCYTETSQLSQAKVTCKKKYDPKYAPSLTLSGKHQLHWFYHYPIFWPLRKSMCKALASSWL